MVAPRYSFSSRHTKRLENIRKQRQKYPALAKKVIDFSDIILEVLDIRFIRDTRNRELEKEILKKGKKLIYVLNKADLVNVQRIKRAELVKLTPRIFLSCTSKEGIRQLKDKIKIEAKRVKEPLDKTFGKVTVGVLGYPNTGKSSLINALIGRSSAGIGADAGFTKGIQKLRLTSDIILLDSPGVIPETEYSGVRSAAIAKHVKVGGRSYSQVREPEVVVSKLIFEFPGVLENFYKISANGDSEFLLEELGRQKNLLKRGNEVDTDKVSRLILKDWQEGNIKI